MVRVDRVSRKDRKDFEEVVHIVARSAIQQSCAMFLLKEKREKEISWYVIFSYFLISSSENLVLFTENSLPPKKSSFLSAEGLGWGL
jgi:hypothetical protein